MAVSVLADLSVLLVSPVTPPRVRFPRFLGLAVRACGTWPFFAGAGAAEASLLAVADRSILGIGSVAGSPTAVGSRGGAESRDLVESPLWRVSARSASTAALMRARTASGSTGRADTARAALAAPGTRRDSGAFSSSMRPIPPGIRKKSLQYPKQSAPQDHQPIKRNDTLSSTNYTDDSLIPAVPRSFRAFRGRFGRPRRPVDMRHRTGNVRTASPSLSSGEIR